MIVYNVGDSHTWHRPDGADQRTGRWCPDINDQYWYKIAKNHYHCDDYINDSVPGRSNTAMINLVIKHCLENPDLPTLYIVNITTIFRIDLGGPTSQTLHQVLLPSAIAELDFEVIESSLYAQLIGLVEFLKSRNKEFLIINNSKNFSDSTFPPHDAYIKYFKQEPRILNWFNNSRIYFQENVTKIKPMDFNKHGWNGHDGPKGHDAYYQMLASRLPKLL